MSAGPLPFLGQPNALGYGQDDVPVASAPGFTGYNAPAAPAAADPSKVMTPLGQALAQNFAAIVNAPRDAYTGDLQVFGPDGHVTDEAMSRANGMAGLAMTGSLPFPAPAGAMRVFGGVQSRTADYDALLNAMKAEERGVHPDQVWQSHGWGRFPDGQWRYEIPDNTATLTPAANAPPGMFRYEHEGIKAAYPELYDRVQQRIVNGPVEGMYDDPLVYASAPTDEALRGVTAHEYQHAIQQQEGFARGGAPSMFMPPEGSNMLPSELAQWRYDHYRRLAGEVEANATQNRLNLTPEQRQARPPWLDFEHPSDQQHIYYGHPQPLSFLGR